jgi:hypothetical protein
MIGVVLAGALPAQAGSIDLVISTLNGQPLQPTQKSITLNPSDTIGIDVVYITDANNFLVSIAADMFFAGTGSGQFDISQMVFTDSYWDSSFTSVLTNDSNSLITIIAVTSFSIIGIQGPVHLAGCAERCCNLKHSRESIDSIAYLSTGANNTLRPVR